MHSMKLHDIPLDNFEEFNVLVETPANSPNKYEYIDSLGTIVLDYVFKDNFRFPFNYGSVPQTKAEDEDPLDAVVISSFPIAPGIVVKVKPICMLKLKDRGQQDDKLITVPLVDPLASSFHSLADISPAKQQEIIEFFKQIGVQKNKTMDIEGFIDREAAVKEIQNCLLYR